MTNREILQRVHTELQRETKRLFFPNNYQPGDLDQILVENNLSGKAKPIHDYFQRWEEIKVEYELKVQLAVTPHANTISLGSLFLSGLIGAGLGYFSSTNNTAIGVSTLLGIITEVMFHPVKHYLVRGYTRGLRNDYSTQQRILEEKIIKRMDTIDSNCQ